MTRPSFIAKAREAQIERFGLRTIGMHATALEQSHMHESRSFSLFTSGYCILVAKKADDFCVTFMIDDATCIVEKNGKNVYFRKLYKIFCHR